MLVSIVKKETASAHLAHLVFCRHTKPIRKKPKELNFASVRRKRDLNKTINY